MQWKKAKENHLPRLLRCFADTFNNKHYTSKEKEKKGRKKPRLTKKSLWRRDENTWNSTNFPNNHTQMGIPPIRIDYPLPHPQSLPHHPRGAYLGAREPSQRALSNRISSQPKVIRHPRQGGGWGWSPGKRGKGGGHRAGSEKREQRERETERRNKRQKDQEGGARETQDGMKVDRGSGWTFLHATYAPSFFPPCLAREIQFSCPHASTHDSATTYRDNERTRSTELHPCTSPSPPCIHR